MYNVTLVNLAADARSAAVSLDRIERRDVSDEDVRRLLQGFCEIDPVENAAVDPEIRVQVRQESYLIRTGQKKLILYDALNRDAPGQMLTVEQVMAELDGTAMAARTAALFVPLPTVPGAGAGPPPGGAPPPRLARFGACFSICSSGPGRRERRSRSTGWRRRKPPDCGLRSRGFT
jgi:hypothetical protein